MADKRQYLYSLVRYVPDVVRGEFVNIGVLVLNPDDGDSAKIGLTTDWSRVQARCPDADVELLDALGRELSHRFSEPRAGETTLLLQSFVTSWSNCLQLTEPQALIADSMESGLERLLHVYVLPQADWSLDVAAGH